VGDEGIFITDTLYNVSIQNFVEEEDSIRTILHSYLILAKTPAFKAYPVFKIEASSDDFLGKYITSVKIVLNSAYYGGPDIDSVICPVYPITQKWEDSNDDIWTNLTDAVDFSNQIGFLKLTDSIANADTLVLTDIELFRQWQDSVVSNYGFLVDIPDSIGEIEKTYHSSNGVIQPVIAYTYKDSANATDEKEGTASFINDMYVFYDQTDQYFTNSNYYYMQTIKKTSLIIDAKLDSLQRKLDETNGVLLGAQLFMPFEPTESYYLGSGMLKFGIYPLAEGWTLDSLAKNQNYVGSANLVMFNNRIDNYLSFSDDFSMRTFASSYLRNIVSGSLENFGWVVQAYDRFQGYEVYAIPKTGRKGKIVYTYWIPPNPRY
jgi:hypothetical protein